MVYSKIFITILILLVLSIFIFLFASQPRYIISSFSTDLVGRNSAQINNIKLALAKINNYKLKPGERFSFNYVVGERLISEGFEPAGTIHTGGLRKTSGGGICQLASTLYNTALLANLKIIQRHSHKQIIQSVPPGLDAAVSYGSKDLVFKNPYNFYIKINGEITASRLNIEILSPKQINDKISIEVERLSSKEDETQTVRVWRIVENIENRDSDHFLKTLPNYILLKFTKNGRCPYFRYRELVSEDYY